MAVLSQTLFKRRDGAGRVAALEVMIGTPAVRNLIRENKISQIPSAMQTGQKFGMQTMEAAIKELISLHLINAEDAEGFLNTSGV
jgi:twitching motility protein PilT